MVKRILGFDRSVIVDFLSQFLFQVFFVAKHICWLIIKGVGVKSLVLKTRQGVFKVSTKDDAIGRSLFTKGQFEYDFSVKALELLRERGFIRADNITLLDVGANIGIISIGLLRSGMVAHAVAIEPEKRNFELLLKNIALNRLESQTVCVPFALGESKTVLTLEISQTNLGDHRIRRADSAAAGKSAREVGSEIEQVNSAPLDDVIRFPEVDEKNWSFDNAVLWTDVQGYEGYVFNGASKFLSKGMPAVSEVWPQGILKTGMSLEEFADIVKSKWSDYWVLRGERFIRYPIAMFDRYLDEIAASDGNVIFTPPPPKLDTLNDRSSAG